MAQNKNINYSSEINPGEEIVISGISGIFPSSESVYEFKDNLYDKINMVQKTTSRNSLEHPEISKYMGTINGMEKFDAQFFKVCNKQAAVMEPMSRKLLEHAYSAIYDAGINPITLKKKRIGVFIATMFCDTENVIMYETKRHNSLALSGYVKSMFSNRISFWLDSNGPSYTLDADYAGSMACLEQACRSIQMGDCEAAVIGASNFHTNPGTFINYKRAGLAGLDAKTKSFSVNAEAPARSDAINVLFLQKAKDAKRIYCEVYHIKGEYKMSPDAKFLPLRETEYLKLFFEEFYSEIDVKPYDVEFVEGFGGGIEEADTKELEAIGQVFGNKQAAKVGSVQSNMGNSGAVTGMCSITKLCLAYQRGEIPANLHYSESNHISSVREGKVQVVTDTTPFNRGFTALNNISFLGTNYHALFKGHYKEKDLSQYKIDVPYLVLGSGRQKCNVDRMFRLLASEPVDPECIGLLHSIHGSDITGHVYRGYAVLDPTADRNTKPLAQSVQHYNGEIRPVVFIYSGVGSQWSGMGRDLMRLPLFAASIEKCRNILKAKGVDIYEMLYSHDKDIYEDPLNCFVGIITMQIALTDLLHEMGIVSDYLIGHSMGELGCAYADGTLTAEQALLSAYERGAVSKLKQTRGAMISVGLGYHDVKHLCPPGIEVACHNSPQSSTLSGPADSIRQFGEKLKNLGLFVREIPSANMAFHSSYIAHNGSILLDRMRKFINNPKPRGTKWLSTAFPDKLWNTEAAKYCSAEYHVQNVLNPVYFEEATKHLPRNAILIEVAPHAIFQGIMRQCRNDGTYIGLTRRSDKDSLILLLESIGKLYAVGLNPKVEILYPKIEFPVSTNTGLLSHYVGWEHSEDWPVFNYIAKEKVVSKSRTIVLSTHDDEYKYLRGHVREGCNVLPEAAILVLVWETLAMYHDIDYRDMSVGFLKIEFHDELILSTEESLKLTIMISKSKDDTFEVSCQNRLVVSGVVKVKRNKNSNSNLKELNSNNTGDIVLGSNDIYNILCHKGHCYRDQFQSIISANSCITKADIKGTDDMVVLLDSLIQINELARHYEGVSVPKYIDKLEISIEEHTNTKVIKENGVDCYIAERCEVLGVTRCAGIELRNITFVNKPICAEEQFALEAKSLMFGEVHKSIDNCTDLKDIKLTRDPTKNRENCIWTEVSPPPTSNTVKVSHAGLSFRDTKNPKYNHDQYNKYLGMDFSGFDANGRRVMGVVREGAVSNAVEFDPDLLWPVPEYWSMEEAATVPLPYLHAYYCLTIKYGLNRGNTILITGGAGGFGQAVIALSLALDCTVFTTVRDVAKKRYLLKLFPQLNENNIGFSEEDAYYIVRQNTKNQRCHVVINNNGASFTEVSMQCVGEGGFYIDVNGTDINEKMDLQMCYLDQSINHSYVDLSSMLSSNQPEEKKILQRVMAEGIAKGIVRPLSRVVYSTIDVSKALILQSSRRHVGRVLINMEQYEKCTSDLNTMFRVNLRSESTYIVVCDETEIGLELANRLVDRGARNLVIHTKFNTGYYQMKQRSWKKLNVSSRLSCENLETKIGCEYLLGVNGETEPVEGIFIVINSISKCSEINRNYGVKCVNMIENLDEVSRKIDELRFFVVLAHSSGNCEAPSIVNKCNQICQERNWNGKPALFLKVGMIDTHKEHNNAQSNTISQKISTILNALETSIRRKYTDVCCNPKNTRDNELKSDVDKVKTGIAAKGLGFFYKRIEENEINTPEVFVNLTNRISNASEIEDVLDPDGAFLLMLPGFDSNYNIFESICERLKIQAVALKLDSNVSNSSIEEMACDIMKFVKQRFRLKSKFHFFGYSFGVNVALELAYRFEREGHVGIVYCLDSSPDILRVQLQANVGNLSCIQLQDSVICHMYQLLAGREDNELLNALKKLDWTAKVDICINRMKAVVRYSHEYIRFLIETASKRIIQAEEYNPKFKLLSQLILIKSPATETLVEDYNLSKYSEKPEQVFNIERDHETAPRDCMVANIINSLLDPEVLDEFKKNNNCDTYLFDPYNLE